MEYGLDGKCCLEVLGVGSKCMSDSMDFPLSEKKIG